MSNLNYDKNLVESKARLSTFISDLLLDSCAGTEPAMFCWVTRRMGALKSVKAFVDEIVKALEESVDKQHEFRINDADLKLHLRIEPDGFVKGYVTNEYISSESASNKIKFYLWFDGVDENWKM